MVKLDLIICPSVDKINILCDNDQFQVRFSLLSSIAQIFFSSRDSVVGGKDPLD